MAFNNKQVSGDKRLPAYFTRCRFQRCEIRSIDVAALNIGDPQVPNRVGPRNSGGIECDTCLQLEFLFDG